MSCWQNQRRILRPDISEIFLADAGGITYYAVINYREGAPLLFNALSDGR